MKKLSLIVCLSVIIISCGLFSSKLPEHNGVFYRSRGGEYQQLVRFNGRPENSDYLKIFDVDDKPTFLFWDPYININLIVLSNLQTRIVYDFSCSTSKDNSIMVSLEEELSTGYYCFAQGDPFEAPTLLKHWCFSIGMDSQRSRLEEDMKLELEPNVNGVFIADQMSFIELSSDVIEEIFIRKDFYNLATSYPVISVRSEYIEPSQLSLYHLRPAIGISFSAMGSGEILDVRSGCIAHDVGIVPGDIIVSVNGINTQSDSHKEALAALSDHLSFDRATDLKIARNAIILDFSIVADCFVLDEVPFASEIKSNYYIFYPTMPLQQGGYYCYSDNRKSGYCFSVLP